MEIVVSLAKCRKRGNDVVAGGAAVVKGLLANPVGERVDAESGLVDNEKSNDTGVHEAAHPVAPAEPCDDGGERKGGEQQQVHVIAVLKPHDGIFNKVRNVGSSFELWVLFKDHPAHVGEPEPPTGVVRVLFSVSKSVVGSVSV